jgi:hypothetical protein
MQVGAVIAVIAAPLCVVLVPSWHMIRSGLANLKYLHGTFELMGLCSPLVLLSLFDLYPSFSTEDISLASHVAVSRMSTNVPGKCLDGKSLGELVDDDREVLLVFVGQRLRSLIGLLDDGVVASNDLKNEGN